MTTRILDDDYWSEARRPLACLLFLIPLLAGYELGVQCFSGEHAPSVRNGADYWMRSCLEQCGYNHTLLLPGLVVGVLLAWQLWGRYPWHVSRDTLAGMLAESLLFAFSLVVIGQVQNLVIQRWMPLSVDPSAGVELGAQLVMYIGAGVYEEVLFRLSLLPAAYAVLRLAGFSSPWAAVAAMGVSSLLFAAAHHIGPAAEAFALSSFAFRTIAGLFFAGLFVTRGFGITVGCHAAYDVLVGVLLFAQAH